MAAPPETVWQLLLDVERWCDWDDELERIEGELDAGGRLEVADRDGDVTTFDVTTYEPHRRLELRASLFFGAWVTVRRVALEPVERGCRLEVEERIEGWAARLAGATPRDPADFARGLGAAAVERESDALAAALEAGSPLAEVLPELEAAYRLLCAFSPNVYYQRHPSGEVDEAGGGLNPYHLTIYTEHEDAIVPTAVIDDGGYDAWGKGQEPALAFEEPPEELEEPLVLPALLYLFQQDTGLLLHEALLEGLEHTPATLRDVYGTARDGYGRVAVPMKQLSEVRNAAARGDALIGVRFPGAPEGIVIRTDLLQQWQQLAEHVYARSLETWSTVEVGPDCYTWLGDWQAGRVQVLGLRR